MGSATANGALDAFEISSTAVVLINRIGEVFQANPSAERLLQGDIRIVKRRLVAKDKNATLILERSIHHLLWRRGGGGLSPPVPLHREGQRPLLAYPAKLSSMTANALADCQAVVILVDPDDVSRPAQATLKAVFGLSEAEARLAARLASGEALELVTQRFGIAKETGRNQLKSVFAKTGVHRQAELVALLAPLLDRICDPIEVSCDSVETQ
jgi:DNA-binding CsgD family transcriptional regulator